MKIPFLAKLVIAILLAVALAEFMPEAVNAVLILILVGVILGNWKEFEGIAVLIGSLGK